MGILHRPRKAAKFVFVDMPLGVLGLSQLRLGNRLIRDLWASLRNVTCPQCKHGVLIRHSHERDSAADVSDVRYPWACTHCDFLLLEVADKQAVRDTVRSMRNQEAVEALGDLEFSARQKRVRQYAIHSRIFFVLSVAAFGGFLYRLATGASLVYAANLASLGLACGAVALKASYRAWQVETGTLFVEGAFLRFLRNERWFR
ncbi:hypothetical protein [Bordetella flabilis]|uniref:Uncharacterized protein n=1 Tax=Bordetella flabilis TaxID=463014 RepID=A0A193GMQ8_9BORD|nr:hypothetical protein [Bordetella flabilis]ANN80898.1 hypothetical protein BAU07_26145 [Bordetella flabilis]